MCFLGDISLQFVRHETVMLNNNYAINVIIMEFDHVISIKIIT